MARVRQVSLRPDIPAPDTPDRIVADLTEARRFEPEGGVYAAFATWNHRHVVKLTAHLDRLEDSARRAGFSMDLDRDHLRQSISQLLDDADLPEARIRVLVAPNLDVATISVEPYAGPPRELQRTGVVCVTAPDSARDNAEAKQTEWISDREKLRGDKTSVGVPYEVLLLDGNHRILEGTRTNFYAVFDGPEMRTAGEQVLSGIARSIVLDVAADVLNVILSPPEIDAIPQMKEAFITSASRGIVPVVAIDGIKIGDGKPGELTRDLIARYDKRAGELEEPLVPGKRMASPRNSR